MFFVIIAIAAIYTFQKIIILKMIASYPGKNITLKSVNELGWQ